MLRGNKQIPQQAPADKFACISRLVVSVPLKVVLAGQGKANGVVKVRGMGGGG